MERNLLKNAPSDLSGGTSDAHINYLVNALTARILSLGACKTGRQQPAKSVLATVCVCMSAAMCVFHRPEIKTFLGAKLTQSAKGESVFSVWHFALGFLCACGRRFWVGAALMLRDLFKTRLEYGV
jgi:hypothetical protein